MKNFIAAINTYPFEAKRILLKELESKLPLKYKEEIERITNELMCNKNFKKVLKPYE
jgi:hypothetical protein